MNIGILAAETTSNATVAITALSAFLGSFAAPWIISKLKAHEEKRSLACALLGEIKAIDTLSKAKRYKESLEWIIAEHEKGNKIDVLYVKESRHFSKAYESNLAKIGTLPTEIAVKVMSFYTMINGLLDEGDFLYETNLNREKHDETELLRFMHGKHVTCLEITKALELMLDDIIRDLEMYLKNSWPLWDYKYENKSHL